VSETCRLACRVLRRTKVLDDQTADVCDDRNSVALISAVSASVGREVPIRRSPRGRGSRSSTFLPLVRRDHPLAFELVESPSKFRWREGEITLAPGTKSLTCESRSRAMDAMSVWRRSSFLTRISVSDRRRRRARHRRACAETCRLGRRNSRAGVAAGLGRWLTTLPFGSRRRVPSTRSSAQ
jgi:hypothetical protein